MGETKDAEANIAKAAVEVKAEYVMAHVDEDASAKANMAKASEAPAAGNATSRKDEAKTKAAEEISRADAIVFMAAYLQNRCIAVEHEKSAAELLRNLVVGFRALSAADKNTI